MQPSNQALNDTHSAPLGSRTSGPVRVLGEDLGTLRGVAWQPYPAKQNHRTVNARGRPLLPKKLPLNALANGVGECGTGARKAKPTSYVGWPGGNVVPLENNCNCMIVHYQS